MLVLAGYFVSAHLGVSDIASALEEAYGAGVYVNPEGPLNIMRGHCCVNNGMIAKQRKYAAPMRLGYSCAGDAGKDGCSYARNARGDEVRELPADSGAMTYLSEHYGVLKSMFTVENDVVVVDKSPEAPFWNLFTSEREKCQRLFAALLLLAGGADIRLESGILVAYDTATSSHEDVLDLQSADGATLEAVKFFAKYGGSNAGQVAGYGLHYTDSPSFLIQAYICEFVKGMDILIRIYTAAKEIAVELPADGSCLQPVERFFTTDEDCVKVYTERYKALAEAEGCFNGAQRGLLTHWQNFNRSDFCGKDDSNCIVSALLKLCYCLASNPVANNRHDKFSRYTGSELRRVFTGFCCNAFGASNALNQARINTTGVWGDADAGSGYDELLAMAKASASKTINDCFDGNTANGLVTDPKNFLVVLAWALGGSEEELQSLQQQLNDALGDAGSAYYCQLISDRVTKQLRQISEDLSKAQFSVYKAPDGARYGVLVFAFQLDCVGAEYVYVVKLIFKPEKVEVLYMAQQSLPRSRVRLQLTAAIQELDRPSDPALPTSAHEAPLRALIRASIEQCLNSAAHQARGDRYIEEMYAAKDPLVWHVAISHWMAYQPMESPGEAVEAGARLLPVFHDLLKWSANSRRPALTADSPLVAVLDNVLGSAAVADDALRELCAGVMLNSSNNRTELFPSIFLPRIASPRSMHDYDESAYDCFLANVTGYGILEMLARHAELRARGKVQAASSVHGPWSSDVCAAVARCFKLRYDIASLGSGGATFNARPYRRAMDDLKRVANETARKAQNLWNDDLCAAAERCFRLGGGGSALGLHGDTRDVCYYRYSICALLAAAANPAEYCAILQVIWWRWGDTFDAFKVYLLLQMAFPKLPTPGPISPKLVARVFPSMPSPVQIKSLLRVFAVFAVKSRDYHGICEVFYKYRRLLRPEYAREYVEVLKRRHNAYSYAPRKIFDDLCIPADEFSAPPFAALEDLLEDCLKDEFDVKTLLQRVEDLPQALHLCARRPAPVRGAAR